MSWSIGNVTLNYPPEKIIDKAKRVVKTVATIGKPIILDWGRDTYGIDITGRDTFEIVNGLRNLAFSSQPVTVSFPSPYNVWNGNYVVEDVSFNPVDRSVNLFEYKVSLIRVDSDYAVFISITS